MNTIPKELRGVTIGWDALERDNPWPEFDWGLIKPFTLSLDAGGRHLTTDVIKNRPDGILVEIGVFLGGSTTQWLESSDRIRIIGVDPWDGNWAPYISNMAAKQNSSRHLPQNRSVKEIIEDLKTYGNFCIALNNLRHYKGRFVPVRQRSPDALAYLKRRNIKPDIIYIDAMKTYEDLIGANKTFPEAVICGDDWNWPNEKGEFQMQEHVKRFAQSNGFKIEADKATWLLHKT